MMGPIANVENRRMVNVFSGTVGRHSFCQWERSRSHSLASPGVVVYSTMCVDLRCFLTDLGIGVLRPGAVHVCIHQESKMEFYDTLVYM